MIKQFIIYELRKFKENFYSTFHRPAYLTSFLGQFAFTLFVAALVLGKELFFPSMLFGAASIIMWFIKEIQGKVWENPKSQVTLNIDSKVYTDFRKQNPKIDSKVENLMKQNIGDDKNGKRKETDSRGIVEPTKKEI